MSFQVGCVVVGIDTQFTYTKMAYAVKCLRRGSDTIFIATNTGLC